MNRNATLLLKLIVCPIVSVAATASVSPHRLEAKTTDHLVFASTDDLTVRYQRLVTQKLFKTPSDFGRVVVCPSFEGEFALSIYSTNRNSDLAILALVRAKKNIWYAASHLDQDLRVNPNVPVKRVNATIKRRVAFEVAEAIRHAIARTQPLAPTEAVRVDGTPSGKILHFFKYRPTTAKQGNPGAGSAHQRNSVETRNRRGRSLRIDVQVSGAWHNYHYDAQGSCILLKHSDILISTRIAEGRAAT